MKMKIKIKNYQSTNEPMFLFDFYLFDLRNKHKQMIIYNKKCINN